MAISDVLWEANEDIRKDIELEWYPSTIADDSELAFVLAVMDIERQARDAPDRPAPDVYAAAIDAAYRRYRTSRVPDGPDHNPAQTGILESSR